MSSEACGIRARLLRNIYLQQVSPESGEAAVQVWSMLMMLVLVSSIALLLTALLTYALPIFTIATATGVYQIDTSSLTNSVYNDLRHFYFYAILSMYI